MEPCNLKITGAGMHCSTHKVTFSMLNGDCPYGTIEVMQMRIERYKRQIEAYRELREIAEKITEMR